MQLSNRDGWYGRQPFWAGISAIALGMVKLQYQHPLGSIGALFTVAGFIWDPKMDWRTRIFVSRGSAGWWEAEGNSSYFTAAQLIAKASMVVIVFSAALMGWVLGNRWAGLVSAFTVPLMPLVMDAALWVNHYPLLGACVGLALAAGVAMLRAPCLIWPCVSGLAAGAAYALDLRGAVAIPMVAALAVCASFGRGWVLCIKRVGLLTLSIGILLAHDAWLQRAFDVPQLPFQSQLEVQRKGTLEQIEQGVFDNMALQQACAGMQVGPIDRKSLEGECGRQLASASRKRLSDLKIIPVDHFLWCIPLACIPLRRRGEHVQTTAMSVVVFIVPVLSLWVGMRWVTYFDRYLMPFAVVFATVVPVGGLWACSSKICHRSESHGHGYRRIVHMDCNGALARLDGAVLDAPELQSHRVSRRGFAHWAYNH